MSVAMSTSIHLMPWNEEMVCPNCSLRLANSTAASYAARAMPTERAEIPIRPLSRACSAILYPAPGLPTTALSGTRHPSRRSSPTAVPRWPITS